MSEITPYDIVSFATFHNESENRLLPPDLQVNYDYTIRYITSPLNLIRGDFASDYLIRIEEVAPPDVHRFPISLIFPRLAKITMLPLSLDGSPTDHPSLRYPIDRNGYVRWRAGRFFAHLFNSKLGYIKDNRVSLGDGFYRIPDPDPSETRPLVFA